MNNSVCLCRWYLRDGSSAFGASFRAGLQVIAAVGAQTESATTSRPQLGTDAVRDPEQRKNGEEDHSEAMADNQESPWKKIRSSSHLRRHGTGRAVVTPEQSAIAV